MDSQEDTNHDETITQFISITGAEEEIARNTLEACNWNVEMAINMYVDSNLSAATPALAPNNPELPSPVNIEQMQSDEVRPPIPPVRQVLVEDYSGAFSFRRNTSFDAFRNFEQETRWQEQHMLEEQQSSSTSNDNSRKTFEDLFRPPLDLIFRGNFEMAKFEGQQQNKWLMVNIQNPQEFACQVLNRDVWSNHAVKSIISEHFIFWQNYHNNSEGQKYINFYNVGTFPYVAIIDPRTGEKMLSWHEIDTMTFCDNITEFLNDHPSPGPKAVAQVSTLRQNDDDDDKPMYEESEDLQLRAAIQASLQDIQSDDSSVDSDASSISNDIPLQVNNIKATGNWKDHLGSDDSPKVEIVIRYPDGNRENIIFPSTSKMKALYLFVTEKGFTMDDYDLITNFPKKNLSSFDEDATLESAGIHSRDTLYVQMKH